MSSTPPSQGPDRGAEEWPARIQHGAGRQQEQPDVLAQSERHRRRLYQPAHGRPHEYRDREGEGDQEAAAHVARRGVQIAAVVHARMGVVAPGIRGVIAVAGVGVSGALCGQFLSVPGMRSMGVRACGGVGIGHRRVALEAAVADRGGDRARRQAGRVVGHLQGRGSEIRAGGVDSRQRGHGLLQRARAAGTHHVADGPGARAHSGFVDVRHRVSPWDGAGPRRRRGMKAGTSCM